MSTSVRDFAKRQFASTTKSEANTNSTKEESVNSFSEETKNCRIKEKEIPSDKEAVNSINQESKRTRKRETRKCPVFDTENKVNRVAVNLTLRADYDVALKVLAAKRRVRPWVILNEALGRYLREANVISS